MRNKKSIQGHPPLFCWDIFMEGFTRRIQLADELMRLKKICEEHKWSIYTVEFENELIWGNKTLIITDPKLVIVHATQNIFTMTGYQPAEVIGGTPKIFQGKETKPEDRKLIRDAIEKQMSFDTIITNYKKDGTIYQCHIEGHPIFNHNTELVNFIAVENAA